MVRITESLIRSRSEHNDGILYNLEEITLHQFEIEKIEYINQHLSLDGEEITHTERIEAKQNKQYFNETLKEAIEELLDDRSCDINTDQSYTPENRLKMYREVAEEKAEKESNKRSQHDNLVKDSIPDPMKDAHKKMSEKAVELDDGTLPRQRNQGQWEFTMTEDDRGNIVVTIDVEKYVSTSLMDIDVHPLWFQCKIKDKLILLHFSEEVKSDKAKVQRIQSNGQLMITIPKLNYKANNAPIAKPNISKSNFQTTANLKPLNENYRSIVSDKPKPAQKVHEFDDNPDVPPLE